MGTQVKNSANDNIVRNRIIQTNSLTNSKIMAFIREGSEPSMLLENHLFYLPSTLTERWNTKDYDIGPSQATFDEAQGIAFDIAPTYNELLSLADIRFTCELHVSKPDNY